MPGQYNPQEIEPEILKHWEENQIYEKIVERNKNGEKWYYLDGPPYTTGRIHVGHAWGKALRDAILRYKRMNRLAVWDRPGFDMHGLPIEVKVEKQLGLKDKTEIISKIGLKKFIETCEKFAIDNLWPMVKDFQRLGCWLDWKDPYMTIDKEYIQGAWWALAKANKNGYLYLGKKAMTWCPRCATALAKHELEYEQRTDNSIFVKMPISGKENEYLIIWTTTPWTIPFNLAIMANPEFDYVKAKVDGETWILAEALASAVIGAVAGKDYEILEKVKGEQLKGTKYEQPYKKQVPYHQENKEENAYTVVLSEEYVTLDAGTGLVHCAPGCGPEDFDVGKQNGISPFNEIDEHGRFPESMGELKGRDAGKDNNKFIEDLREKGLLIESTPVEHEYAHCWRCKTPVLFRATDQWFLACEKIREKMREKNKEVYWVPDWAGSRSFDSWLKGLQDWCISRQRFWGIPLPIWTAEDGDIIVVESAEELEKLSGQKVTKLHRPEIDEIVIKKDGKEYRRIEDILDVWFDSGVAPWASLGYPGKKEQFEKLGWPDMILEGKDQIRAWFNSLLGMSMMSFGEKAYKAVYMHGHINDAYGRKMSKSLGNIISPYEVIDTMGADTLRFYTIGGANPGLDLNYNHEDAKLKRKNLTVLWNLQNFIIGLSKELDVNPEKIETVKKDIEEKYIYSRLHSTIKQATEHFEKFELDKVPGIVESLFLDLSRDYIQFVRDKAATGSEDEKKLVLDTAYNVMKGTLEIFAPIAPFITDKMWLNFRQEYGLEEESIHMRAWPKAHEEYIDEQLEQDMQLAKQTIQAGLYAREKAKLGIRWPVKSVDVVVVEEDKKSLDRLKEVLKQQLNTKEVKTHTVFDRVKERVKADEAELGKQFGKDAPAIKDVIMNSPDVLTKIRKDKVLDVAVDGRQYSITRDHIKIERDVPEDLMLVEFPKGALYLSIERNDELDAEGYAREAMRRVQALRKKAGLNKEDKVKLEIISEESLAGMLQKHEKAIADKCGAELKIGTETPKKDYEWKSEEKVKGKEFKIFLEK